MTFLWPLDPNSGLLSHHKRPLGHHTRQMSPKHLRKLNQMDRPVITFSVASVDCLITPTLDPSVLNQITLTETKKYVQDRDKEMAVVQRALLNTTGPLCSLHDTLSSGIEVPAEDIKCIVE